MRIWVDENIPMGKEAFSAHGEVIPFPGRTLARGDIAAADALIIRSITRVNADLLEGAPVRFVGTATIGTDHVDQAYLASRGIGFAAAPGCNANSVGEYVTAALAHLQDGRGFDLVGKTIGIIGHGHVGKQVERKAEALGLRVLKCDPPLRDAALAAGQSGDAYSDLGDLLEQCDILTLHTPLTRTGAHPTFRLAGEDFFARLARPCVLINSCRGEVIDEEALKAALTAGKIRHLVLDVFAGEPDIDQSLCARADLITPHIAGYSLQGKLNGTTQVAAAFRACFGFATTWRPVFPAPTEPGIRYAAADSDAGFLQRCVQAAYPIIEDDRRLRESFLESAAGKAFDRLRRDYPVRHEFPAYAIHGLPPEKRELASRLLALGFRMA